MYYHRAVGSRLTVPLHAVLACALLLAATIMLMSARQWPPVRDGGSTFGARHRSQLRFVLSGVLTDPAAISRSRIERQTDWRKERRLSGAGWELGCAARKDGALMKDALTVVQQRGNPPLSLRHCYTLAAFDLSDGGKLAVMVRDPQYYWPNGSEMLGVTDPVDLVWYDDNWNEERFITLDYSDGEFPDGFVLAPAEKYLLCIRHPEQSGKPVTEGHSLNMIWLVDGTIADIYLPEVDGFGYYPASWLPLGLRFEQGGRQLAAQAGDQLRIYDVEWNL